MLIVKIPISGGKNPNWAAFLNVVLMATLVLCSIQVVKAKVLNCDVEKEKLLLSFKAVAGGDTEASPKPTFDFEVGKVRKWQHILSYC